MLIDRVEEEMRMGWHLELLQPHRAVMSYHPPVRQDYTLVNLLLTFMTCGLWLPVWLFIELLNTGEAPVQQLTVIEDRFGNITTERRVLR